MRALKGIALAVAAGWALGLVTFVADVCIRFGRFPAGDLPGLSALALLLTVFVAASCLPILAFAARIEALLGRWLLALTGGILGGYAVAFLFMAWGLRRPSSMVLGDWQAAVPFVACGLGIAAAWIPVHTPPNRSLERPGSAGRSTPLR